MAKTPQEMLQIMLDTMKERTGKEFGDWVAVAKQAGIDKHKALTDHMKKAHGLNHNQAQWVAWEVTDPGRIESYNKPKDLVAELYAGKKQHLRPIYDKLMEAGNGLGDVRVNVCKTYSSLAGKTQFAIVNPRTMKLVDLELSLPEDTPTGGRLEKVKTSNPKFNHRIRLGGVEEIDQEVVDLLAAAYGRVK